MKKYKHLEATIENAKKELNFIEENLKSFIRPKEKNKIFFHNPSCKTKDKTHLKKSLCVSTNIENYLNTCFIIKNEG